MCDKIGVMVLAEGVESREEVLTCMKKNIDIFQGYWFSKPKDDIEESSVYEIEHLVNNVGHRYKENITQIMHKKQALLEKSKAVVANVVTIFQKHQFSKMELLSDIIAHTDKLEAIYILEETSGLQIGDTIINVEERFLYNPAKDGHNHALREYYFITKESIRGDYLSTKYLSKASGNVCRTYSCKITVDESHYILCCDLLD